MAFTSNWEWVSRNRVLDVNIDSSGTRTTRNNWTMTRTRISDAPFASELGDEADVLSAYAGAELVAEYNAEENYIQFDATQNWTDTTYKYYAYYSASAVGSGGVEQYYFVLNPAETNKPNSAKMTVVRPRLRLDTAGRLAGTWEWYWYWECGEWDDGTTDWIIDSYTPTWTSATRYGTNPPIPIITPDADATPQIWTFKNSTTTINKVDISGSVYGGYGTVDSGSSGSITGEMSYALEDTTWEWGAYSEETVANVDDTTTPTNYVKTAEVSAGTGGFATDPTPIDGLTFSTVEGTFTGSADSVDAGLVQPTDFYCSNDSAIHTNGVSWYKQTQVWIYKDEYV